MRIQFRMKKKAHSERVKKNLTVTISSTELRFYTNSAISYPLNAVRSFVSPALALLFRFGYGKNKCVEKRLSELNNEQNKQTSTQKSTRNVIVIR